LAWKTNDTEIIPNFKSCAKIFLCLNLANEGDALVLETDASNEH